MKVILNADEELKEARADYELANRRWMESSIFDDADERTRIKAELVTARARFVAAIEGKNPSWIVF